jgi:hypothetical protein
MEISLYINIKTGIIDFWSTLPGSLFEVQETFLVLSAWCDEETGF